MESKRLEWDIVIMRMLEPLIDRSICLKVRTAAFLVIGGNQIISMGYNGTFSGAIECPDHWKTEAKKNKKDFKQWIKTPEWRLLHREWSLQNEVHAEENALKNISVTQAKKCTLYTIKSPCVSCTKQILSYGIKRVVYREVYKKEPLQVLIDAGVQCDNVVPGDYDEKKE